jgi:hypothetical protein
MAFGIKTLLAGSWAWMTGIVLTLLYCFIGFKIFRAQSRWWCNTGIVGFDPLATY